MTTGYEVQMYQDIARIAKSLERIANALEQKVYGVTGPEVGATIRQLQQDAIAQRERAREAE
jgi:hypothetical protein